MVEAVFGRRGSGKTTLIRAQIPELKKPVLILDILGNFSGYEDASGEWLDTTDIPDALSGLKNYLEKPNENPGIIVLQTGNVDQAIDYFCSALWESGGGTLVLDEVDAIRIADAPCFDEAIRYGRNRGIDIVFGCRRPAEVSKNLTAAADRVYCFATREPRDIMYYREFLGDERAERIQKLEVHHGILSDFNEMTFSTFKTTESGEVIILNNYRESTETPDSIKADLKNNNKMETEENGS